MRLLRMLDLSLSGGQESPYPLSIPRLETPRLLLRAPRRGDERDLLRITSDPLVSRYVLWGQQKKLGEARQFLSAIQSENRAGGGMTFAIERREDGRMIGTVGFGEMNREHFYAECGYSLARDCWGQGYASEALARLLRYGFETLKLNRVEGLCDVRNPASARVMEKCGMQREGVLRGRILLKGEYADVWMYGMLARDWPSIG